MNRMKPQYLIGLCILFLTSGCTPPLLQCFLNFPDFEKTYEFDISKEELKNQIVGAYTYDKSLLLKNFGLTLIENEKVNSEYRQSVDIWLDKRNWDDAKSAIRSNTADTLNLLIGKHHSWKQIKLIAIIKSKNDKSSLTIKNIEYQRTKKCEKDKEYYKIRIADKIERKLIKNLI